MVSACPSESDPRQKVSAFVSDMSIKSISGLRDEGLDKLMELVMEEIRRQDPEVRIIILDRDFLSEHDAVIARDLANCLFDMTFGTKSAIFMEEHLPVINWQEILPVLDVDVHLYHGSLACRQIPLCVRIA
ncbi:MAG: hypothetical protein MJZ38_05460 [archaeon]|nr:hypothetical protein [archaeon]